MLLMPTSSELLVAGLGRPAVVLSPVDTLLEKRPVPALVSQGEDTGGIAGVGSLGVPRFERRCRTYH